jgi:hypothetical protein
VAAAAAAAQAIQSTCCRRVHGVLQSFLQMARDIIVLKLHLLDHAFRFRHCSVGRVRWRNGHAQNVMHPQTTTMLQIGEKTTAASVV